MTEPGNAATSSEIVFYQGEDGRSRIQVRLDGGTVWLTQRLLGSFSRRTYARSMSTSRISSTRGSSTPGQLSGNSG